MLNFIGPKSKLKHIFYKELLDEGLECTIAWLPKEGLPLALYKKLIKNIIDNNNLVIGMDPECSQRSEVETLLGVYQGNKLIAHSMEQLVVDFRIWGVRNNAIRRTKRTNI